MANCDADSFISVIIYNVSTDTQQAQTMKYLITLILFLVLNCSTALAQRIYKTPEALLSTVSGPGNTVYGKSGQTLYVSTDGMQTKSSLYRFNDIITGLYCMLDGTLFVATDNGTFDAEAPCYIWRSRDGGLSFDKVKDLGGASALNWSFASDSKKNIYVGEYGAKPGAVSRRVWKSSDFGESWEAVFYAPKSDSVHVHVVAVDPYTDNLWVSNGDTGFSGLHVSEDQGASWTTVREGVQPTSVAFTRDAIFWGEDGEAGIISRYDRLTGTFSEEFVASDRWEYGGSVYAMTAGADGYVYASMVRYPGKKYKAAVFAGRNGVWHAIHDFDIDYVAGQGFTTMSSRSGDGYIYLDGYRIKDYAPKAVSVSSLSPETLTLRCSPNPFNGATLISFSLAHDSFASLMVYSVTGQCVRTLVKGRMQRGAQHVSWDSCDDSGNRVSSGIYFVKLLSNAQTAHTKLLFLK